MSEAVPWLGWIVAAVVGLVAWLVRPRKAAKPPEPSSGAGGEARAAREALAAAAASELARAETEALEAQAAEAEAETTLEEIRDATAEALDERSAAYAERKRRTRSGPLGLVLALGLGASSPARAVDVERMAHPRTGAEGHWVADWLWREALAEAEALPHCMRALEHTERATASARAAAERLADVERVAAAERASAAARLEALEREAAEREAELAAWYRSPWLHVAAFALGALAGAYATREIVTR